MRVGVAFEFLGQMASATGYLGHANSDIRGQLFDSGIGLLDAIGSVVSLWEAKKATRLMKRIYNSSVFVDFINAHQCAAEREIALLEKDEYKSVKIQIDTMRSETMELIESAQRSLKIEQEQYRKEFVEHLSKTKARAIQQSHKETELHELRNVFLDAITLSQAVIEILRENEIYNHLTICEFDDKVRKTTILLQKTFNNAV